MGPPASSISQLAAIDGPYKGYIMATIEKRLVTWKELKHYGIPFSRQHWDRLERAGEAPRRIQLGECRVVWELRQIEEWLEARKRLQPSHRDD